MDGILGPRDEHDPGFGGAPLQRQAHRRHGAVARQQKRHDGVGAAPVNNAYEIVVKGKNVIRMSITSVDQMRANPGLNGVPFLAPFANRLDEMPSMPTARNTISTERFEPLDLAYLIVEFSRNHPRDQPHRT